MRKIVTTRAPTMGPHGEPSPALLQATAHATANLHANAQGNTGVHHAPRRVPEDASSSSSSRDVFPAMDASRAADQSSSVNTMDDPEPEPVEEVTDGRRNWTPAVTLELARVWRRVTEKFGPMSHQALLDHVHTELQRSVDCSQRSKKSVEGKLYGMKRMYIFVADYNANRDKGQRGWFELSRDAQRRIRAAHNIKDPKITREVYEELDKFLNGKRGRKRFGRGRRSSAADGPEDAGDDGGSMKQEASDTSSAAPRSASPAANGVGSFPSDVVDNGRNWSHEVTLQLARVWYEVQTANPSMRGATLSKRVYDEFMDTVQGTTRSRKAVDDKMHCMKEMYRFISEYNDARAADAPAWFELSKEEQREYRNAQRVKYSNIAEEVYDTLDLFLRNRYPHTYVDFGPSTSEEEENEAAENRGHMNGREGHDEEGEGDDDDRESDDEADENEMESEDDESETRRNATLTDRAKSVERRFRVATAASPVGPGRPRKRQRLASLKIDPAVGMRSPVAMNKVDLVAKMGEQVDRLIQHWTVCHQETLSQRERHHAEQMELLRELVNATRKDPIV